MRICGYVRARPDKPAESASIQKRMIAAYARSNGLVPDLPSPTELAWYLDRAPAGRLALAERPAGRPLSRALRAGDHVIVATLDRACRGLRDFCSLLTDFVARDIRLHVCNLL